MSRRILVLIAFVAALVGALPASARAPLPPIERLPVPPPPEVTAKSWILFDDTAGLVLGEESADEERPMASTTKIMTGLVAYRHLVPGQRVVVSARADAVGEAEIGLVAGEEIAVEPLIAALLIRSGNDAATAVAEAIGGTVEEFVGMMNEEADLLGLEHTAFANPHGLDEEGHYSSARDLLTMARAAMTVPQFAEAVGSTRLRLADAPDGTERVAEATNRLLYDYPGAFGVKTGFTFKAGLVLVAGAERDGRRLYAVVMGSEGEGGHFKDAAALLDHGFNDLRIVPAVTMGVSYRTVSSEELAVLANQAAFETLIHVSSVSLMAATVEPTPTVQAPEVVALGAQGLPSLSDALTWFLGGSS